MTDTHFPLSYPLPMTTLDILVALGSVVITIGFGLWYSRKQSVDHYLANNRGTRFPFLLASNVSSWVGAGAIIGVSSAAYKSGISYGLSVLIVNVLFCILFAIAAPRISRFGSATGAFTVGDFFRHTFGTSTEKIYAAFHSIIILIWCAVQLLALGQLISLVLGTSITIGLTLGTMLTLVYTGAGGLRSDIATDTVQFLVMLLSFSILLFTLGSGDHFLSLRALPSQHLDATAFGGPIFLVGSILIGCFYPWANTAEWQRVFAAHSPVTARRAYLWSWPWMLFFIGIAVLCGLVAKVQLPSNTEPDQAFLALINTMLPSGVRGLMYAGIFALVMSSIDSLLIAGSSTVVRNLYYPLCNYQPNSTQMLRDLKIGSVLFAFLALLVTIIYPSIVELTILVSFLSMCFAPAVLVGLLGFKIGTKYIDASIICGLVGLFVALPILGNTSFVVSVFLSLIPLAVHWMRCSK